MKKIELTIHALQELKTCLLIEERLLTADQHIGAKFFAEGGDSDSVWCLGIRPEHGASVDTFVQDYKNHLLVTIHEHIDSLTFS